MPNTFASPLDLATVPDNQSVEGRLRTLEARVARNTSFDVQFGAVQEAADDLGYYQVGNFISGTGTPEGGDLTGVAIMYPGFTYTDGVTYNLIGMNNGNLQFGLSALDGTALFASGAGVINAQGVIMTGLYYPVQFSATNAGNTRTGSLGMTLLAGGTIPNLQILYQSASGGTLVLNGASPADLTSWTDSASAWSAYQGDGYTGVACFRHDPTVLTLPALLTQTITGLTAGVRYNISFASRRAFGYLTPKLFIVWKTSGHATIRTDTITGNAGGAWSLNSQNIVAPATTAEATLELDNGGGDPFQDFRYDAITMGTSGVVMTETFTDIGFQFDGGPILLKEITTPATPSSGYGAIYPNSTDSLPHAVDDSGVDHNLAAKYVIGGVINGQQAQSSTKYCPVYGLGGGSFLTSDAQAAARVGAGVISNAALVTSTTQPNTGSLVATLMLNGVATAIVITVAANRAAGTYQDTTHTITTAAGDTLSWKIVKNATALSANLVSMTLDVQP